jgi:hypothetical protein
MYRFEATSIPGFIQQLAVSYIGHGYWFYVTGRIPEGKDPAAVDRKLVQKYGLEISKWARARRKKAGLANVHYIRYGRFFVLLASKGEHEFFREEPFKDIREDSIRFEGYSIGLKKGVDGRFHPSVRIHPEQYGELKAHFLEIATRRSAESLEKEFKRLPYQPYAPVCRQLLALVRGVNRAREMAGLQRIDRSCLRLWRKPVKPFGEGAGAEAA